MRVLVPGTAAGPALVLEAPLSLWGGVDPETGRIVDNRHPQSGEAVAGKILFMPMARGSSSSSSVLAELLRADLGPLAIVLGVADSILVVGALVARHLYGASCPVIVGDFPARTGQRWEISNSEIRPAPQDQ